MKCKDDPLYDKHRKSEWYQIKHTHNLKRMREWRRKTHDAAISKLGGACACCGESRPTMLDIDHVNGGGRKDRNIVRGNNFLMYQRIAKEHTDLGVYQVLCCNCNQSKRRNGGSCEHASEDRSAEIGFCA